MSRIILFIVIRLFIIDGVADRVNNLTTTCLTTTVMNCRSPVFNDRFRMAGTLVNVWVYSVSTKCTVLLSTIISVADEEHLFIDLPLVMNNE